jgi:hypothetical protein
MNHYKLSAVVSMAAVCALLGTLAVAEPTDQPEIKLPPGWTQADMQACMVAAMPGKMHEHLAKSVGVWNGNNTMWMFPGADPVKSESTTTISPMLDGRFIKCEIAGEMPGMGPYTGFAIYGYDNVAEKFVGTWVDNCGTGVTNGTGELSSDGKTMTWTYSYNCPINKKPTTMREIETTTGPNSKKLEMFGIDPKSGKEFKMMEIELSRQ